MMLQIKKILKEYNEANADAYDGEDARSSVSANSMGQTMKINFTLRILRMMLDIISISYFVGMGWLLLFQTVQHFDQRNGIDIYQ